MYTESAGEICWAALYAYLPLQYFFRRKKICYFVPPRTAAEYIYDREYPILGWQICRFHSPYPFKARVGLI